MEHAAIPPAVERPVPRSRFRRGLESLVTLLLVSTCFPSGAANLNPAEREYAEAVRSFRTGRTSEAFGQFMALANRGDVDSARIALFMHNYGAVLYGRHWDAGTQNVAYWSELVRNSGTSARPLPEFTPAALAPRKRGKATRIAVGQAGPALSNVSASAGTQR